MAANRRPMIWIGLAIIALLLLAYLIGRPPLGDMNGVNHPAVGKKLALVELEPLTGDGRPVTLSDLQGKVTLVNIWGTWCPPCADEFPYLGAIYEKWKPRSEFQYLSISYDDKPREEVKAATAEFLRRMRVDHATYYDPGQRTLQGIYRIGVEDSFPTTLVLDRSGTIRGVWLGYSRSAITEIERLLDELLK